MIIKRFHLAGTLVATALALAGTGRTAWSQDRELLEDIDEPLPLPLSRLVMDQTQFELRVFGRPDGVDAARKRLEKILKGRIESLADSYHLTDPQRKKLWVAGQGDIKRFFDSVEETRAKLPLKVNDQETILEIRREIQQLGRNYRSDLFSRGSIFAKTLSKTLNDEQSARFKKESRERKQMQFRATLTWVAGTLEQTMKLTADQRRQLEKALIEETRAPEAFGINDYYGLIFQASKISESKLKPIFDDDQWQALTRQFQEVGRMEKTLKDGGYLPMDEAAAAAERPAAVDAEAIEDLRFFPPIRRR